jgi:predicted DCC family thiol-disulfide oxidoreductase YuxK
MNIIFYDGECGFCNQSVRWILVRDKDKRFHFASLQSSIAEQYLGDQAYIKSLQSLVLVEGDSHYFRSDAVLRIATNLRFPYHLLSVFRCIPEKIRDSIYRWVARNRMKWMRNQQTCEMLSPEDRARFLN